VLPYAAVLYYSNINVELQLFIKEFYANHLLRQRKLIGIWILDV